MNQKKSWLLPNKPEKISDGVNPYREEYLDKKYPDIRENEYKMAEGTKRDCNTCKDCNGCKD